MDLGRLIALNMSEMQPPTGEAETLEQLLDRVAAGDEKAFGSLYDRTSGLVFGIVRRVVRDPAQSEEVAQEVMVDMWRTARRFDSTRGSAKAWIATIAHRRAVDLVRSVQASRDRSEAYGRRDAAGAEFDVVSDEVIASSEHSEVRTALAQLTDIQREVIELAYYRSMTYREVADHLDTPLGTVKTRMRDGMIRLRQALGPAYELPGHGVSE